MKSLFLSALLVFGSLSSFAQSRPEEMIEKFFKEYAKRPDKAVENIYATNPWTSRIRDGVESVKNEVNKYTPDYVGKYYGYEFITKKQLGESFIIYAYMVKYDRQPMRFIFEYYKPNEKWVLFAFKIDSQLDDEMEQAVNVNNLNLDREKP